MTDMPRKLKPRIGRPPRAGHAASVRLDVRVTPDEDHLWRAAAERAGVGLRRFIADATTAAARKLVGVA
jgi:uncharacterized protein (DUF1778 family)